MEALKHFLTMGGYGVYVWSAYVSMIVLLGLPWLTCRLRWKKYLSTLTHE